MSDQSSLQLDPCERLNRASRLISSACAWSAATGFIPIPFVDMFALAAVQIKLANVIATLYGQSFKDEAVESSISVLLSALWPAAASGPVASGVKAYPGVGTLLGVVTLPALASASTYAMGRVLVRHFERGGTGASFSASSVKEDLRQELAAARTQPNPA